MCNGFFLKLGAYLLVEAYNHLEAHSLWILKCNCLIGMREAVAFIDSLVLVLLYYFTMYSERPKIPWVLCPCTLQCIMRGIKSSFDTLSALSLYFTMYNERHKIIFWSNARKLSSLCTFCESSDIYQGKIGLQFLDAVKILHRCPAWVSSMGDLLARNPIWSILIHSDPKKFKLKQPYLSFL